MANFAAFVTTAADLAEVLKKEFSLDPATSLSNRAQVASYTVAWQSAQARTKQQKATSETRECQAHPGIGLYRHEAKVR